MTVLYLSPHLDDAALSASIAIQRDLAQGEPVVVATFFTEAHDGAARRSEDRAAMEVLGATPIHLGLVDFPERRGVAPSFRVLCVDRDEAAEAVDLGAAEAALDALLTTVRPTRAVLPLGIGGHVDHRIVARLAPRVVDLPVAFYEDFPYAMVPSWVEAAFARPTRVAPGALQAAIDAALPGFAAGAADIDELARLLASPLPAERGDLTGELLVPSDAELARKLEAVACYRSQSAVALGGRAPAALYALHAHDVAAHAGAERVWSRCASRGAEIPR